MRHPAIPGAVRRGKALLLLRWVGIAIIFGGVLAALGPFGSYMNGGPVQRAGYWIASVLLGLLLYGAGFRVLQLLVSLDSRTWWPSLIAVTLLISVPQAFATRAAAFWLWPNPHQLNLSWNLWFTQTATIGLVAMIGAAFLVRNRGAEEPDDPGSSLPIEAATALLGKDVLALQMEDHYVRVHRPSGSDLFLMPLGRAIKSVEAEGLRIHRSWWVARHAVRKVEGNARSMRLHLENGTIAPVARSAVTHLKTAGWIADEDSTTGQFPLTD